MRTTIVCLSVVFLLPATALSAPPDRHTLSGMDAVVAGGWLAAVLAFEAALAEAPKDAIRAKRLAHARKRAIAFWDDARKRCVKAGVAEGAKLADQVRSLLLPDTKGRPVIQDRPEARLQLMLDYGKSFDRARAMHRDATKFLIGAQEREGRWKSDRHGGQYAYDPGVTGLAILAILAGERSIAGPRQASASRAVDWLVKKQSREGRFGYTHAMDFTYSHAVATRAVAAFALATGQEKKHGPALVKAAKFIEVARNPDAAWRYGVRPGDSDTSATYWMIAALERARAAGIEVDGKAFDGARGWMDKITDPEFFRAGYTARGTGSARRPGKLETYTSDKTEALTAAACLIRNWCGERGSRATRGHLALVRAVLPTADCPDMYYWYLGARAFASEEGRVPRKWYDALVSAAERCRGENGSMDPIGPWGEAGGRIYSTAIVGLALMAPLATTRPSVATSASGFLRRGSATVRVPISNTPRPTGLYLDESMRLTVAPTGTVHYGPRLATADPGGLKKDPPNDKRITKKGKYGCLLGQVGPDGRPFVIQRKRALKVKGCGELFVFVNAQDPGGATGGFTLEITVDPE